MLKTTNSANISICLFVFRLLVMQFQLIFCKEQRASLIATTDRRLTFTEITRHLGAQWSSLAIEKKQVRWTTICIYFKMQEYINRSNADKERYKCELLACTSIDDTSSYARLHCSVCDRYFTTRSNRAQHLQSKAHRIALTGLFTLTISTVMQ